MKKLFVISFSVISLLALSSCFKDEAPNSECDITAAYLHTDNLEEMFYNSTDTVVNVMYTSTDINFNVRRKADLTALAPRLAPQAAAYTTSAKVRLFIP